jgi:hypothetical protein
MFSFLRRTRTYGGRSLRRSKNLALRLGSAQCSGRDSSIPLISYEKAPDIVVPNGVCGHSRFDCRADQGPLSHADGPGDTSSNCSESHGYRSVWFALCESFEQDVIAFARRHGDRLTAPIVEQLFKEYAQQWRCENLRFGEFRTSMCVPIRSLHFKMISHSMIFITLSTVIAALIPQTRRDKLTRSMPPQFQAEFASLLWPMSLRIRSLQYVVSCKVCDHCLLHSVLIISYDVHAQEILHWDKFEGICNKYASQSSLALQLRYLI